MFILGSTPAQAEIFQWKDENGKLHFGDVPPDKKQAQPKDLASDKPRENLVSQIKGRWHGKLGWKKADIVIGYGGFRLRLFENSTHENERKQTRSRIKKTSISGNWSMEANTLTLFIVGSDYRDQFIRGNRLKYFVKMVSEKHMKFTDPTGRTVNWYKGDGSTHVTSYSGNHSSLQLARSSWSNKGGSKFLKFDADTFMETRTGKKDDGSEISWVSKGRWKKQANLLSMTFAVDGYRDIRAGKTYEYYATVKNNTLLLVERETNHRETLYSESPEFTGNIYLGSWQDQKDGSVLVLSEEGWFRVQGGDNGYGRQAGSFRVEGNRIYWNRNGMGKASRIYLSSENQLKLIHRIGNKSTARYFQRIHH